MFRIWMVVVLGVMPLASPALATSPDSSQEARMTQACRALAASFQKELKAELMTAMASGGPANAISVCQKSAPLIAAHYSALPGWEIRRTALRLRNPGNTADEFETATLAKLASDSLTEHSEWVSDSAGVSHFRYMSAIPMAVMCSGCHGDPANFPDTVKSTLAVLYPDDKAIGFRPGELRGAFSITVDWPEGKSVADSLIASAQPDSGQVK